MARERYFTVEDLRREEAQVMAAEGEDYTEPQADLPISYVNLYRPQDGFSAAPDLRPMPDITVVIKGIERRMEHQYKQCSPECVYCAQLNCPDCDRYEVLSGGVPSHTYIQPCSNHIPLEDQP
jgi:hypothetical protein